MVRVRVKVSMIVVAALLVLVGGLAGSGGPAAASLPPPVPTYRVIQLGGPTSGVSSARDVNERGQVSGVDNAETGLNRGWTWDPSTAVRTLMPLNTDARRINEHGDVAVTTSPSFGPSGAARWDAATKALVPLPRLAEGGRAAAADINDDGLVAGAAGYDVLQPRHAVLWESGGGPDLIVLVAGGSFAAAVNASGQVVGGVGLGNESRAFRKDPGVDQLVDLGSLGGFTSASDINDAGAVVGWGYEGTESSAFRGFVIASGSTTMTPFGTPGERTLANGINNHGVVVGYRDSVSGDDKHAFVRSVDGTLHALPDGGEDHSSEAVGINDRGWIAGSIDGRAVLWVPTTFPDVPITHPFFDAIAWMVAAHLTGGYADGNFHPGDAVTRQAVAAFLYRLSGSPDGEHPLCDQAPFDDVPVDHPLCGEIAWLVHEGLATGYAGNVFKPGAPVSRQALAAFLYRLAGNPNGPTPTCDAMPFDDVPTGSLFCGHIAWLAGEGIASGYPDGGFHPTAVITRQAVASFLYLFDRR